RVNDHEPRGHDRQGVHQPGEAPRLRDRELAGDQRPRRFVDAIDLQVGDLVQRIRGSIEKRCAERAQGDGQDDGGGERARGVGVVRGAEGADGAGDDADQREDDGSPSPPPRSMNNSEHKIALFIDFENIAIGVTDAKYKKFEIELLLERLLEKGKIVVKRAYCDWDRFPDYKRELHEAAI